VFGGEKALSKVKKNDRLKTWFASLAVQIDSLDFDSKTVSGTRLTSLFLFVLLFLLFWRCQYFVFDLNCFPLLTSRQPVATADHRAE
jgi:hypothetical protein